MLSKHEQLLAKILSKTSVWVSWHFLISLWSSVVHMYNKLNLFWAIHDRSSLLNKYHQHALFMKKWHPKNLKLYIHILLIGKRKIYGKLSYSFFLLYPFPRNGNTVSRKYGSIFLLVIGQEGFGYFGCMLENAKFTMERCSYSSCHLYYNQN